MYIWFQGHEFSSATSADSIVCQRMEGKEQPTIARIRINTNHFQRLALDAPDESLWKDHLLLLVINLIVYIKKNVITFPMEYSKMHFYVNFLIIKFSTRSKIYRNFRLNQKYIL